MIPENVEKIIMTKEDYERNVGKILLEKIELEERLETIERYIRKYDTNTLDTKTLCILNDILLIKNGIIEEK